MRQKCKHAIFCSFFTLSSITFAKAQHSWIWLDNKSELAKSENFREIKLNLLNEVEVNSDAIYFQDVARCEPQGQLCTAIDNIIVDENLTFGSNVTIEKKI